MSVYFMSDLHLGHKNIAKFRELNSSEENDEMILDRLSGILTKRDKIYLVGDNAFTVAAFDKLMSVIPKGCVVDYVIGNHDFEKDLTANYVASKVHSLSGITKYKHYWISHAPIHSSELRGKLNIHGHTHHKLMGDGYINVCVEHTGFGVVQLENLPEFYLDQLETYYADLYQEIANKVNSK